MRTLLFSLLLVVHHAIVVVPSLSVGDCDVSIAIERVVDDPCHVATIGLVDGRVVLTCDGKGDGVCTLRVPLAARTQSLHLYRVGACAAESNAAAAASLAVVAAVELPQRSPLNASCGAFYHESPAVPVGMLYEGWHGPPSAAMSNIAVAGGARVSVEDVMRDISGGSTQLSLYDIVDKFNQTGVAANFYYQATPAGNGSPGGSPNGGFYCIYRKRASETVGEIPDCEGIEETLTRHANDLVTAGISFVTIDGTNLGEPSPFADLIQVRPAEVLLETWYALRARGLPTPNAAVWQCIPPGTNLYQKGLSLYNNATYADMIQRDPASGKMVFFVPDTTIDPTIVAIIESNGGLNNIIVQKMWAEFDTSKYSNGTWSFFSPCLDASGDYTSSVIGLGRGASGCGQYTTSGAVVGGTQGTVSPSYQLGYGSLPFAAANKYQGLTLKRQFATLIDYSAKAWELTAAVAVANANATASLGAIYLSSYNEWTAQPQPDPYLPPFAASVGVPDDAARANLFVDSWGSSMSRDLEESTQAGGLMPLVASCLRVLTLARAADTALTARLGATRAAAALRGAFGSEEETSGMPSADEKAWLRLLLQERTKQSQSTLLVRNFSQYLGTLAPPLRAPLPTTTDSYALWRARVGLELARSNRLRASGTACSVAGEACCEFDEETDGYVDVWALQSVPTAVVPDWILSVDPHEVAAITCLSCAYTQTCAAFGSASDFCQDSSLIPTIEAQRGPFILHSGGCGSGGSAGWVNRDDATTVHAATPGFPPLPPWRAPRAGRSSSSSSISVPNRAPLFRCRYPSTSTHFLSNATDCSGGPRGGAGGETPVLEMALGCLGATRDSNLARRLRVCATAGGPSKAQAAQYHILEGQCKVGDLDGGVLGYVR